MTFKFKFNITDVPVSVFGRIRIVCLACSTLQIVINFKLRHISIFKVLEQVFDKDEQNKNVKLKTYPNKNDRH